MKVSANLGLLWNDRPLPDAIRAAADSCFDAVECHWPYDTPVEDIRDALSETGLPMLGLNTRRGKPGEMGLAALPGREAEARDAIEEAIGYAVAIGAQSVHVMAGATDATAAEDVFCANLAHASEAAAPHGIVILIEPLNPFDAPGYALGTVEQAARIIEHIARPELKLMFDCYHRQLVGGDLCRTFDRHQRIIGHVQVASVPGRLGPDTGEVDFVYVLTHMAARGWTRPIGMEYRVEGAVEATLGWMDRVKGI